MSTKAEQETSPPPQRTRTSGERVDRGKAQPVKALIGVAGLIITLWLFGNMFIFFRLRKRALADRNDPTLHFKA